MAKRRTKKQKLRAKHSFSVSWNKDKEINKSEARKSVSEANVKRQIKLTQNKEGSKKTKNINPENTDKTANIGTIKKDITKSLILAGIIIASEIVLYLLLPK